MNQIVVNGDNLEVLKNYPDKYFDAVVTDPPYGLGKEPDAVELMKDWIDHGYHEIKGSGFMGKEWDAFVPQPKFWKEVFRVLKHGGHVLAFYGTRTYDWGVMAMRFAGFEVRDTIYWHYGSGFPKSHNISLALDKMSGQVGHRGKAFRTAGAGDRKDIQGKNGVVGMTYQSATTEEAKQWEGWGSALKPASEPIVMARKPLEKGLSIAENVLKYGTGGINIDGCRVGLSKGDDPRLGGNGTWGTGKMAQNVYEGGYEGKIVESSPLGRFPANLIMTHHPECECKGLKKVKSDGHHSWKIPQDGGLLKLGLKQKEDEGNKYGENGKETIEDWDCHEDCPIRIMDEQSGQSKSNPRTTCDRRTNSTHEYGFKSDAYSPHSDSGGASRFFYCAKASKSERNKGLIGFVNGHPTIKPLKLMQYLVRLVTPPNGKVLDPFCGSGTTGIACKLEGFEFVGIEQDPEYTKIAEARINNWVEDKDQKDQKKEVDKKGFIQQDLF